MMDPNKSDPDTSDPVKDAKHPPVIDYAAKKRRIVILLLAYSCSPGSWSASFQPMPRRLISSLACHC